MTKMTLENTINELKLEAEARGLNDAVEAYAIETGKAVSKFNKNDYLVVLGDKDETAEKAPKKSKEEIAADKEASIQEAMLKAEEQKVNTATHNNTKVMCIVTDHYTGAKLDDEEVAGRVYEISWGNKMGSVTARVVLDGEPQYLHIGTIRAMRDITLPKLGKNSVGKEYVDINGGKRFTIVEVDGWSEDRLEQEKQKQKIRNA